MHHNYHFLQKISTDLLPLLKGKTLLTCFSQNKDEVIFGFSNAQHQETYIRATLTLEFSCLNITEEFHRAKRNSINLFSQILDQKVIDVIQSENERSFQVKLTNKFTLLFKLFGNRSNVILFKNSEVVDIFNHNFEMDYDLLLTEQNRILNQTWEKFQEVEGDLRQLYPTFGKVILHYLNTHNYENLSLEVKWGIIQELLKGFENQQEYYVTKYQGKVILSMLEIGDIISTCKEPIEALNTFYRYFSSTYYLDKEKDQLRNTLTKKVNKSTKYVQSNIKNLEKLKNGVSLKEIADVLMANLYNIEKGAEQVELFNFYTESTISIKLNRVLSPQKNAEKYYRKSKNQSKELGQLEENILVKQLFIEEVQTQLNALEEITNYKELKKFVKENNLGIKTKIQEDVPLFKNYLFEGYQVFVGRNSRNNDELTQRYAHKNDFWLHAKDVSGSHVVIRHKAGQTIPQTVIEKAAALAAFYSKRKTDSLCPVSVTEKKYVRKLKGSPAGAVMVDREKVIMVVPQDFETVKN